MSSGKREKDRHVSGTGRRDTEKKGGHGTWGKIGEEGDADDYILDKGDPNYQSSSEDEAPADDQKSG